MREHTIQIQIAKYLRIIGWTTICTDVMSALGYIQGNKRFMYISHYKQMGYTKGTPDLLAFKDGRIIFIEVKSAKGRIADEQKAMKMHIKVNGFGYLLARSLDDVMEYLK